MFAIKIIPNGTTATKVNVFGSTNFSIRVYSSSINSFTTTNLGAGNANTELDITDLAGTGRNYIVIEANTSNLTDKLYGATITLA